MHSVCKYKRPYLPSSMQTEDIGISVCLKISRDLKEQKIYVVQMHSMLIDSSTGCNILLEHKKGTVADLGNGMQRPHFSSLFNRIVSRKPMENE